jgi:hypothetical protein
MVRRISKQKYLIAFAIAGTIFIIGILVGVLTSNERVRYLEEIGVEQRLDYESIQVQYLYISDLAEEKNCPVLTSTFETTVLLLERSRERLEDYLRQATVDRDQYEILKRDYTLAELKYWLLSKKVKTLCERDIVTVLYLYSDEKTCPDCAKQGMVLTYLKKIFEDKLLVFSLDSDFNKEPMIMILKESFNVTVNPTLVIDDETYQGFMDRDDLLAEVCSRYKEKPEECEDVM